MEHSSQKYFFQKMTDSEPEEDLDGHFFDIVYAENPARSFAIFISMFHILFVTPFFCFVIWFEKFGADHHRTLLNQVNGYQMTSCNGEERLRVFVRDSI